VGVKVAQIEIFHRQYRLPGMVGDRVEQIRLVVEVVVERALAEVQEAEKPVERGSFETARCKLDRSGLEDPAPRFSVEFFEPRSSHDSLPIGSTDDRPIGLTK